MRALDRRGDVGAGCGVSAHLSATCRSMENGTARCVNTGPLLTTVTRVTEEVAGMTPAYLGPICQQVDHPVTLLDGPS